MRAAVAIGVGVLALAACTFDPTIQAGRISCKQSGDCTSGFRCVTISENVGVCCRDELCRDIPDAEGEGGNAGGGESEGGASTGGTGGIGDAGPSAGRDGAADAPATDGPGVDVAPLPDGELPRDTAVPPSDAPGLPPGKCNDSKDCTGLARICKAGACVVCVADSDCTAPLRVCRLATNICVQCKVN